MRLKYIFLLCLLLIFTSCSSGKLILKPSKEPLASIDAGTREKSSGSGKITLLEHQLLPIDYLRKHPEIRGILVNHYMGTGKTYLGIGFAQAFPDHPIIILAPRFLESHWHNQLQEYGVKNPQRFMFVSYEDAPKKLRHMDLSRHILLADEAHNLIKKMRGSDPRTNDIYTELYLNLRQAYKILALTGTPIYSDESDLAFMINLVSGENLMPFNQETFRLAYTKIKPTRQFFRGYLTESNLISTLSGFILGNFFVGLLGPIGFAVGIPIGILTPVIINASLSPTTFKLRELNVEKMLPIMNKYISYFRFDESKFKDFPAQDFEIKEVSYNRYQYSFFLHLVEGDLPVQELQRLLKNDAVKKSDEMVNITSTQIQEHLYSIVGSGRDIGNFEFFDKEGKLVEPPKFVQIYKAMQQNPEPTVIYSSYYQTGILAFEAFLKRQGFKEPYSIIEPNLSVFEVNRIVSAYNNGDIKLLLLHPDVTEGISLKGTQYLHILEPMLNATVLEQVIGRTRRFQSHSHLPKEKQVVKVRMWQSTSSAWDPEIGDIKRANWFKRYRELSYMSRWGIGIVQVDKNYERKALNPEELALLKLRTLETNLGSLQKLLSEKSIENTYVKISDNKTSN